MAAGARQLNTEHAVIEQLLADMRSHGIEIDEPVIADGLLHRYHHIDDRRRERNVWIVLFIDDRPAGKFGDNKRFGLNGFPWSMAGNKKFTAEERKQLKVTMAQRAEKRRIEIAADHAAAKQRAQWIYDGASEVSTASHPYLIKKNVSASPKLRVGKWYYIDEDTGEDVVVSDNALIVPIMSGGEIHSLQAIIPDDQHHSGFRKQYLKDGRKEGGYMGICRPKDDILLICEGVATGLSLAECTGHGVLVAFDSGNLKLVAIEARRHFPDYKIVICADNDQFTLKPIENPGVRAAEAAAKECKGLVAIPEFSNLSSKPTDFNDLHQLDGKDGVADIIEIALLTTTPENDASPESPTPSTNLPMATPPKGTDDGGDDDERVNNPYFKILGYEHDTYYMFQFEKGQILEYSVSALNDGGLIQLASLDWWEAHFRASSGGIDKKRVIDFIMRYANARGIFDADKQRGRGAWLDNGRNVYHHGQYLTVDNERVECTKIKSKYVYQLMKALPEPTDTPLSDDDGMNILNLASHFRWTKRGSAALLCGWIALAPFCGALKWRPHIWLTGEPGSGKSSILELFIHELLKDISLYTMGGSTTEPGLRQTLKIDALPVLIDEAEQNEEKDFVRIQNILTLMRQSSSQSQAQTFKGSTGGTAQNFYIRSMFCLVSIQVGIKQQADAERITLLSLQPKVSDDTAADQWNMLKMQLDRLIKNDPSISTRLFRRGLETFPTTLKNIHTFTSVAARIFRSQRTGDQYGTLLAGAFGMTNRKLATEDDAEWFINAYDWSEHINDSEKDDPQQVLQNLLGSHIRGPKGVDVTVFEVVCAAQGAYTKGIDIDMDIATALLARYGMKLIDQYLILSNSNNELHALMSATKFKADWRGVMLRVQGTDRNENKPIRMNGVMVKVIRINLKSIFEGEKIRRLTQGEDEESLPF